MEIINASSRISIYYALISAEKNSIHTRERRSNNNNNVDDAGERSTGSPLTYRFSWPNNSSRAALSFVNEAAPREERVSRGRAQYSLCWLIANSVVVSSVCSSGNPWWCIRFDKVAMDTLGRVLLVATAVLMCSLVGAAAMTNQDVYPGEF